MLRNSSTGVGNCGRRTSGDQVCHYPTHTHAMSDATCIDKPSTESKQKTGYAVFGVRVPAGRPKAGFENRLCGLPVPPAPAGTRHWSRTSL